MSTHNNYERFQEAKCDLGLADIVNAYGYIKSLSYYARGKGLHRHYKDVIEPLEKFISACWTNKKCPRCEEWLFCSDVEGYDYVCVKCDENFYECEVE